MSKTVAGENSRLCSVCQTQGREFRQLTHTVGEDEQYFTCSHCGSVFIDPVPDSKLNAHFDSCETDDLAAWKARKPYYFVSRLQALERHLESNVGESTLLDVGCGDGSLMKTARKRGWRVEGVELSEQLASKSRECNPEVVVHHEDFMNFEGASGKRFDAIVGLDVIEHLRSPRAFLRKALGLLTKGGLVLIQTPNARSLRARLERDKWNMLKPTYHFQLFSPRGLLSLLDDCGFNLLFLKTVSGSGKEDGIRRAEQVLREKILSMLLLGNAMLALARAEGA